MNIRIEEKQIDLSIRQTESSEFKECCGVKAERRSEEGYLSASDLNRPPGAKGEDWMRLWMECPSCGEKASLSKWPKKIVWIVEIFDFYGNFICSGSHENKNEAIRKASSSFEDLTNSEWIGE
jgi:hypothetical protein